MRPATSIPKSLSTPCNKNPPKTKEAADDLHRCSIGAAFTPRNRPDLPEPLDDFFAARSKALLELEMDSPSLCTVQAMVILSAVEALLTRDARGWLYSGEYY